MESDAIASTGTIPAWSGRLGLTARETEVVALLLGGNTIAALSCKLNISENTTRGHMKRIYRKLDIHSRQELIELVERTMRDGEARAGAQCGIPDRNEKVPTFPD